MPQLPPSPFHIEHIGLVDDYIRTCRAAGNWEYPYTDISESEMIDWIRARGGFCESHGQQVLSQSVAQDYLHDWAAKRAATQG